MRGLGQSLANLLAERERLVQLQDQRPFMAGRLAGIVLSLDVTLAKLRQLVAQLNYHEVAQPAVPRREHGRLGGGPREVRAPRGGADENWKHSQRNHGDGA